ncbi:MAG: hypothetical protein EOS40_19390 [Mesorhizobium sp.]|nr:MAG: hypothetical protein EOS40_19390 [Mesorhizobium sp.]
MCYDFGRWERRQRLSRRLNPDRERTREADYYARKVGMTRDEALRIIREADPAKLSTLPNGNAKRK